LKIYGIDFTSAPKRDKPIVVADCEAKDEELVLQRFLEFTDWPAYEQWLREDGQWIGGFDFPFGLPKRFVEAQGWPRSWRGMVEACVRGGKENFVRDGMRAFQAAKELQDKHRATDLKAKSESPLKTNANPPVGRMFYEGAWRLIAHDLHVPVLHERRSTKIALEAYPGLLISRLGERYYKNDSLRSAETNIAARKRICTSLKNRSGEHLSCALSVGSPSLSERLQNASGDWLDAVLCAMQAHWSWLRRDSNYGLPRNVDPVEGWIVSA
jgi:uncharacterized protein DUF429